VVRPAIVERGGRTAAAVLATLGAVVAMAAPARAQSTDPAFVGHWTWSPEIFAPEATGLGGAYVTTLRGADALVWSPAGITFDSGLDVRTSFGVRPGFGLVRHGERLHLGFAVRRTFARTQRGDGFDAEKNVFEVGQLAVRIDQIALGAGLRSGRLRVGVTLLGGPLGADGAWSRVTAPPGPDGAVAELRYDYTGRSEWQVGAAGSAILELLGTHPMARNQARLGVAARAPTLARTSHYRRSRLLLRTGGPAASTTALAPFAGSGPDLQAFRLPAQVSVGAEARISVFAPLLRSLRLAMGADWADYAGVLDTARGNDVEAAGPVFFDDTRAWMFGGGLEGSLPLVRVRVGLRQRAHHNLVLEPVPSGDRKAVLTFGASHDMVLAGKRLQFDFDSTNSFDQLVLAARILW
jgi:hypothetical protein